MLVGHDNRELIVASGDGTLCVLNLRKGVLEAASDNQEDELLSLALIKVTQALSLDRCYLVNAYREDAR